MVRTALRLRWIAALLLALALAGAFVLLSQWQFSRSTQSQELSTSARTETPRPLLDVIRPGEPVTGRNVDQIVTLAGRYNAQQQVLVPHRLQDGRSGYWVVTAFTVTDAPTVTGVAATVTTTIPIARGWAPNPDGIPAPPSGPVTLTGRLLPAEAPEHVDGLTTEQVGAVATADLVNRWQVTLYRAFVVAFTSTAQTDTETSPSEQRQLEPISVGPQPVGGAVNWLNIFYAVEWFIFAAFAIFLWWRLVADDYERRREAPTPRPGSESGE